LFVYLFDYLLIYLFIHLLNYFKLNFLGLAKVTSFGAHQGVIFTGRWISELHRGCGERTGRVDSMLRRGAASPLRLLCCEFSVRECRSLGVLC
jgi:hypothetical protein